MRDGVRAQHFEGGAVVFVVAHADDAAGIDLVEQRRERRALSRKWRVDLDHPAPLSGGSPLARMRRTARTGTRRSSSVLVRLLRSTTSCSASERRGKESSESGTA